MMKRTHRCGDIDASMIGQSICVNGWVHTRRDHGGLIFIDVRDRYGIVQVVFNSSQEEIFKKAHELRNEYVIAVKGIIQKRPEGTENPKMKSGQIELIAQALELLNTADPLPFEIEDNLAVSEEVRFTYRYLDLRRPCSLKKMLQRHELIKEIRAFLSTRDFVEVETPILTKSTPEGARDYLVPSRVNQGSFFALPQSPQLFKQILMVSGLDRYFQIAKCFRDEDLRADRQPEFTQLDLEMSFIEEEDIFCLIEELFAHTLKKVFGLSLSLPFPRLTHAEAMRRFGNDKPDLRLGLEITDISDLVKDSGFGVFQKAVAEGGKVKCICVPGCSDFSRSDFDALAEFAKGFGAKGLAYMKGEKGTLVSPIVKFFTSEQINKIQQVTHAQDKDTLFFVADKDKVVCEVLSRVRIYLDEKIGFVRSDDYRFLWVTQFPLFKYNDEDQCWESEHHPFTSFHEEDRVFLEKGELGKIRSSAYDLVLNGVEIGSGSIRIHSREIQQKIFEVLGITKEEAELKFGFLLKAFSYGAPPHGGFAPGIDRIVAMLTKSNSIREVIAFPKTQKAVCPMTAAPSVVSEKQLKELGIKIKN